MTASGHVFVVQGRIEDLVHDAAVVPTDEHFTIERSWHGLLRDERERVAPNGWGDGGQRWAQSQHDSAHWFIDVAWRNQDSSTSWLLAAAEELLTEVARSLAGSGGSTGRVLPLVAVPVLGIGAGGFGAERGAVLKGLLDAAGRVVRAHAVDIAFVTPDAAVHAAMQHQRRKHPAWGLSDDHFQLVHRLAERARNGELALFLGAGVSIPAGLPTWDELLRRLSTAHGVAEQELAGLGPLDQAEALRLRLGAEFGPAVARECRTERHAIAHSLLASLGCTEVVTTNFDACYEHAVESTGRQARVVLPWQVPVGRQPWLLKLHGDVAHPKSIVLSRRHFVRYDASSRPAASVLQSLMMTRHLLVVGASLTDDNVLRLAHEVAEYREASGITGEFGTVLDVADTPARRQLWRGELGWEPLPGARIEDRARALEVFLDVLAAHATTDASWVLDERFEVLLDDEGRAFAASARQLAQQAPQDDTWDGVRQTLIHHGAGRGGR